MHGAQGDPAPRPINQLINHGDIVYIRGIEAKFADPAQTEKNRVFTEAAGQFARKFDRAGHLTMKRRRPEMNVPVNPHDIVLIDVLSRGTW